MVVVGIVHTHFCILHEVVLYGGGFTVGEFFGHEEEEKEGRIGMIALLHQLGKFPRHIMQK